MYKRCLIVVLIFVVSCGSLHTGTPQDISEFVSDPENGLVCSIKKNELTLELIYRPKELVILQEFQGGSESWSDVESRFGDLEYFLLRLSKDGKNMEASSVHDPILFGDAMRYLGEGIESDLDLRFGRNSIHPEGISFASGITMSNTSSVMAVFKSEGLNQADEFEIVFNDSFFGTGQNTFKFKSSSIRGVPKLDEEFKK